jgi:UDP-N-acetylglucosamine 2-epimerase (non-hydrolysing)
MNSKTGLMSFKILTVVGTRPEIIKLSRVIAELDANVTHVLVHTGQNYDYELNQVFFDDLGIRAPDQYLDAAGENAAQTIANVISKIDGVLEAEEPDAMLLLGDTNSCLSVIAAKRRKIPVFHMEAGNRCFDQRVPEEINRKLVDHCSDVNMPYTEHARRYLLAEGLSPETVIKTGSPMLEVLEHYKDKIASSDVMKRLELESGKFFLVSAHREENVDSDQNLSELLTSLDVLAEEYEFPIVVSTHPRTRNRIEGRSNYSPNKRISFIKPLGFSDYCHLQVNAACVVSDSGTITEEASILDFPAVTIRETHERPEGMDEGALIMSGLHSDSVLRSVSIVMEQVRNSERPFSSVPDYQSRNVSKKVLRTILSYTEYVNRVVWSKRPQ